ncbi:MAG: phage holin family protein [Mariniphaga sp.]
MDQLAQYFEKLISWGKLGAGFFIGAVSCWMFPDDSFVVAAQAVIIAMFLDIITKYVALSKSQGGYFNAVRTCTISSNSFWKGTSIKIYAYCVIGILIGLVYRVVPLQQAGLTIGTAIYSVILLRECQSILENLIDAGADVGWLKKLIKKKEKEILKDGDDNEPT